MRKTATLTITDEGRDKGRVYLLTEMSAEAAEWWATRALMALAKSGMDIGDTAGRPAMESLVIKGVLSLANVSPYEIKPLFDELMTCIQFLPDPVGNPKFMRPPMADDIEEVQTRYKLKMEVFSLHTGFSMPEAPSNLASGTSAQASTS